MQKKKKKIQEIHAASIPRRTKKSRWKIPNYVYTKIKNKYINVNIKANHFAKLPTPNEMLLFVVNVFIVVVVGLVVAVVFRYLRWRSVLLVFSCARVLVSNKT